MIVVSSPCSRRFYWRTAPFPEDVQRLLDPDGTQRRQLRRNAWAKVANWLPILMDVRCRSGCRALQDREEHTLSPEEDKPEQWVVNQE